MRFHSIMFGLCVVMCAALIPAFVVQAQSAPGAGKVEVSFVYATQRGSASNQFAVWVEDPQGRYVKTLYATKFTASGGWEKRPASLFQWVKQSGLASMTQAQADAFSGATPKAGTLRYVWDGTDHAGRAVPAGEYKMLVEATLRGDNRVVYAADVRLGETGTVSPQGRYSGDSTAERGMISRVTVTSTR